MQEAHSVSAIYYAGLFGLRRYFRRPEIHKCYISSIHWNHYAGNMFTAWQADDD